LDKRVKAIGLGLLTTAVPLAIGYLVSSPPEVTAAARAGLVRIQQSRRQARVSRAPARARVFVSPGPPVEGDVCIYPPTDGRMTSPVRNIIERLACPLGGGRVVSKVEAMSLGYSVSR